MPGHRKFINAKKIANEIIGDLGPGAKDYISTAGPEKTNPFFDKVIGRQSADGKKYWRVDFNEIKGAHVNWQSTKEKGAILFEGGFEKTRSIIVNEVIK